MLHSEALRFLVSGLVAALVNVGTRVLFSLVFSYGVSIVLAYLCGMAVAFLLNRYVVFASARSGAMRRQGLRFAIVNAASLLQVWIIGEGLVRIVLPRAGWHWHPQTAAHCIAVATPAAVSYFAHKYFSFRSAADLATTIGPPAGT
jgi:putative flippase GtrA